METDVNWTYRGDHFLAYANIESLCCTLETNTMLYFNYISTKVNNRKKQKGKEKIFTIHIADKGQATQFFKKTKDLNRHMANVHLKRCSMSSVREKQIKITVRYQYISIRLAKIPSAGKDPK